MTLPIQVQRALHLLTSSLAVTAQRLPFIKHFAPLFSSPLSLQVATPLAVSFGGTHCLTGQTTAVMALEGFDDLNTTAKVGEPFTWQFLTRRHNALSYQFLDDLPDGISYTFGIPVGDRTLDGGTLSGIPTTPGVYEIGIIGWRGLNFTRESTLPYDLTIVVEDTAPGTETPFTIWRETIWNSSQAADETISGPQADPDGDGLLNILEYFLNLNPRTSGTLPGDFTTAQDDDAFFIYELPMNNEATDVTFTFQRSSTLNPDEWVDIPTDDPTYVVTTADDKVILRFPKGTNEYLRLAVTL